MMKTLLLLFLIVFLFSCKKNNTNAEYNITGTWTLSSQSSNGHTYLASDFPCMANQIIVIESNSNAMSKWHDDQTCWLNPEHTVMLNLPGSDSSSFSFVRNGNKLIFPITRSNVLYSNGEISSLNNNKLQLTLSSAYTIYNNPQDTIKVEETYIKN